MAYKLPQATRQAPDSDAGTSGGKPQRKAIARREWIGDDGKSVENEQDATGARYVFLADQRSHEWRPVTDDPATRMFAIFGALTLAGNVTNTWDDKPGDYASPIDAVAERFSLIQSGQWVDRSDSGAKVDKDVMAEAMIQLAVEGAKVDANDTAAIGTKKAEYREKLESADFVRTVRKVPAIAARYAQLVGATVKTLDDVL